MAAPMACGVEDSTQCDSSWSDSSDDEVDPSEELQRQRFQEAVVTSEYIFNLARGENPSGPEDSQAKSNLPSKRSVKVNDHEDENVFGTTPGFRDFVSRKLEEKLDREIEFCVTETPKSEYADWICQDIQLVQQGVHLFSDSADVVCETDDCQIQQPRPHQRRPKIRRTSSPEGSEESRLASVAVTVDILAQQRAMWERLSQSAQDVTEKQGATTVITGNNTDSVIASQNGTKRKKKKKKKRKDGSGMMDTTESDLNKDGSSSRDSVLENVRKKKKRKHSETAVTVGNDVNGKAEGSCHDKNSQHVKKKKKQKHVENAASSVCGSDHSRPVDGRLKTTMDTENVLCGEHEPVKKKKKRQHKSGENSVDHTIQSQLDAKTVIVSAKTNSEHENCHKQQTKKKKKHKNGEDGTVDANCR